MPRLDPRGAATWTLRAATFADAPAIADVLIAARHAFLPFAPSPHSDVETHDWVQHELLADSEVHVGEDGARIIAVLAISTGGACSWIDQLYVLPGFDGRGVSAQLLALAHRILPPPTRLYTFQANVRARRFYERHGYRAIRFGDGSENEEGCPDVLYERRAE